MEDRFSNPFWYALHTEHASFAIGWGLARRYPGDVIPFGGLENPSPEAMAQLRDLLAPGEIIYVTGKRLSPMRDLVQTSEIPGWQMHFEGELPAERPSDLEPFALGASDASAMVALTDLAFPGFFRPRTYSLGRYCGLRAGAELIAMAGERVALPGFREISAVCTHPAHTGRGYAALLVSYLLRAHAAAGLQSFLHVAAANQRAITLYERLGFVRTRSILFHQLRRT